MSGCAPVGLLWPTGVGHPGVLDRWRPSVMGFPGWRRLLLTGFEAAWSEKGAQDGGAGQALQLRKGLPARQAQPPRSNPTVAATEPGRLCAGGRRPKDKLHTLHTHIHSYTVKPALCLLPG